MNLKGICVILQCEMYKMNVQLSFVKCQRKIMSHWLGEWLDYVFSIQGYVNESNADVARCGLICTMDNFGLICKGNENDYPEIR